MTVDPHTGEDHTAGESQPYVQVWGDAVTPAHLWWSVLIGATGGLGAFLLARWGFESLDTTAQLRDGYALLVGLGGCVVAASVCAWLFPPKRVVHEEALSASAHDAAVEELAANTAGLGDISQLSAAGRKELEAVGLYDSFARRHEEAGRP